jgi:hypothetical protein
LTLPAISTEVLANVYKSAKDKVDRGVGDPRDTTIVALWEATLHTINRADGLQRALDLAYLGNAQSAQAVTDMTLRLASKLTIH